MRCGDKLLRSDETEQDQPVDQRAANAPGDGLFSRGGDERNPDAVFVANLGDADHHCPDEGIGDKVGECLGGGDTDRIDLAAAQHPSFRIGPGIVECLRRRQHTVADFLPDEFRAIEDIGNRSLGHPGLLGDIGQSGSAGRDPCHARTLGQSFLHLERRVLRLKMSCCSRAAMPTRD